MCKVMALVMALLCVSAQSEPLLSPNVQYIEKTLAQGEGEIDLALSIFMIEKELNPSVNISRNLGLVSNAVEQIRRLPEFGDTSLKKMGAILRYVYTPGPWNNYQSYSYDFSSTASRKLPNQMLVSHYLATKTGNCLSMPLLLVILGDRLGVDVKAAIAPYHMYARFKDDNNQISNIEATSGTLATDKHYIEALEVSELALTNKVYLASLTKKELIAYLLNSVGRRYLHRGQLVEADSVASLTLEYFPNYVDTYFLKGNIQYSLLQQQLAKVQAAGNTIPPEIKTKLDAHFQANLDWFAKAERLGWQEPSAGFDAKYEKSILKFKAQ